MSTEKHDNDISLFEAPEVETATRKREWITVRPINQLTEGAAVEFNVPGTSMTYIDLKNLLVHIKIKIVKADGSNLEATDKVGLTNNALHSIFSQVNLSVQQQQTSEVGANYAYKAYLDTLLHCQNEHDLNCQLFIKDESGNDMRNTDPAGANNGLYVRAHYTVLSKEVDLIGRLYVDLCQQDRFVVNGVPINIKLWQQSDRFRLLSKDGTEHYKVRITEASLKVALVKLDPDVIVGQSDVMKTSSALYPYSRSVIKTYAVPQGQFSFITDDVFQGQVPQELIVGIVESATIHGSYVKNPFDFQNFDCNYAGFFVDGQSTPSEPLQPNYKSDQFIEAYQRLYWDQRERAVRISRKDFKDGYCLYVFRPNGDEKDRHEQRAHTRLELKFAEALPSTCTVIVYAKFPALMRIDASRNVFLE